MHKILLCPVNEHRRRRIWNVDTYFYLPPGGLCPPGPSRPTVLYYEATVIFDQLVNSCPAWCRAWYFFSRLLCRVTWPKYFSFRDFIWPSKALSCPTLRRTSSFRMHTAYRTPKVAFHELSEPFMSIFHIVPWLFIKWISHNSRFPYTFTKLITVKSNKYVCKCQKCAKVWQALGLFSRPLQHLGLIPRPSRSGKFKLKIPQLSRICMHQALYKYYC